MYPLCFNQNIFLCRYSCSIEVPEEDKLMIAGGVFDWGATTRVTKYDKFGNFEEMPFMKTGRGKHACGSYLNGNQQRVDIAPIDMYFITFYIYFY